MTTGRGEINGQISQQIKGWIHDQVQVESNNRGHCKKIVLRHLNVGKKVQGDVGVVNISRDQGLVTEIDFIVNEIAEKAQQDANDLNSGLQLYAIFAYFAQDANYCPRKVFRVAAEDEIERDVDPSEPPTEKGVSSMLMRHLEITQKNTMVTMGYQFQTMQKENARLREQNERYADTHFELLGLMQEMMDRGHKRRIDEKQAELQMSMVEGVYEHLKIALPVIVNRLAGKEVVPQKVNHGFYLLASLLEGMSQEQQNQLQETLSPQQLTLLAEILQIYEEERHKNVGKMNGSGEKDKLLTLFEKRGELVKQGKAVVIDDEKLSSIEKRAKEIMEKALQRDAEKK
jgi:hypothetical protein